MRPSDGQPVRLSEYRAPDYFIDHVELDVSLDIHATRVVSTLSMRPNPAGRAGVALALDGDELMFVSARLDGEPLDASSFEAKPSGFVLRRPPRAAFTLTIETRLDPAANTKLMGLYRTGSAYCTQCEAEGFRRITYFLDRPDVLSTYRVRVEADRAEAPVLLSNGNLETRGRSRDARPSLRDLARSAQEAVLPVRAGRRRSRPYRRFVRHRVWQGGRACDLCRTWPRRARALRNGRAQALDGLGRTGLRARIRSRHFQHRRRLRFQYGRDGEQGPQRLQRQVCSRFARDRDRRRLFQYRRRDRARIFSQLDRRSHHLPRLVPALPQRGADRFPRPGFFRRHALGAGRAHRRCAHAPRGAIPRGRGAARAQCAPRGLSRDQQLLHCDRLPERR